MRCFLLFSAVLFAVHSFAAPLTITYSSIGSGSIGAIDFTDAAFTITEQLDTDNRHAFALGFVINDNSASISIDGVGNFDIMTPTASFVNQNNPSAGYSHVFNTGDDLIETAANPAFATWDMTTSLGPISGTGTVLQWAIPPQIQTSGGTLLFVDESATITFDAVVGAGVPEPSSFALLTLGFLGFLGAFRRTNCGVRWTSRFLSIWLSQRLLYLASKASTK